MAETRVRRWAACFGDLDQLTPRERLVLELMADGYSNPGIARELVVSLRTVESHVSMIFMKLGLSPEEARHRRVQAVLLYKEAFAEHTAGVTTCLQF
jgi:DNA-binding NarL/FixJ family response regulator